MLICKLAGLLKSLFNNAEITDNVIGTVIGGLLLTLILFFFNEFIFHKPNIVGEWIASETIKKASVDNFKNLKLEIKIHLLQKGMEITGTGEKIMEIDAQGNETRYPVDKRVHWDIEGYVERNYLRKSKISLLIYEDGRLRPSSTTFILKSMDSSTLSGTFISTAANATGEVVIKKSNG